MKVLIVGSGNNDYADMFLKRGWNITNDIFDANLVQFTGGEDVTPEIYGEKNTNSYNNLYRDFREAGYFAIAQRLGKPMAGICRGGQFLNVMCGGKMIQHVEGHATGKTHLVYDHDVDKSYRVTSTHHQAMIHNPDFDEELEGPIAFADDGVCEVIHYENQNCLCFQPHPEFKGYDECTNYYFELLARFLGLEV